MNLFVPLSKVDQVKREVWGWAAVEEPDRARGKPEIMDYDASKPNFEAWSLEMQKASGGKSLGNVRAMHGLVAAGKLVSFRADDAHKGFYVGAKIVDDNEWQKVVEGVYTGFSIGGDYGKRWADGGMIRYEAVPNEISIVDLPCIPGAMFEMVKVDGGSEMRPLGVTKTIEPEGGSVVTTQKKVRKAAADPQKALELVQALRDEAETGGDLATATLYSQAITLLVQVGPVEETPTEEMPAEDPAAEAETPVEGAQDEDLANAEAPGEMAQEAGSDAPVEDEEAQNAGALAQAAKAKKLRKSLDAQALHNVIKMLAHVLAENGNEQAQAVLACYATSAPAEPAEAGEVEKGAQAGELQKRTGQLDAILGEIQELRKRVDDIGRQPAGGGPALMPVPGATPMQKILATGGAAAPVTPAQPSNSDEMSIEDLRKTAATEPNPLVKADLTRRLWLAEQATALRK